jgi:mannose-1-phosphate guanylyltransferase/mannose-6-phosphate isomerase
MIHPVILCGGAGTRLWPLSRKAFPKQFSALTGADGLFISSARMLSGADFHPPLVVTGSDFRFVVTEQLAEAGLKPGPILIEPEARNTAPAILAAALTLSRSDPEAIMLVAPSDHAIPNPDAFRAAALSGLDAVRDGRIVTFGITPNAPETGYGWLELAATGPGPTLPLRRFVEKPDKQTAEHMLQTGGFLWNSGIFLFSATTIIEAFKAYAPEMLKHVTASVEQAQDDMSFLRLAPGPWAQVTSVSIDYAVMEHSDRLSVLPYDQGWNDLGSWDAVAREMGCDDQGVAQSGSVTAIDCQNSLLRSDSEGLELVGIGLRNLVVVAMNDAVLVADRSRGQEVKVAVDALRAKGARQAETFLHDHRPWGHFETLALGERFQVKRIVVRPGAALSLQSHLHRSEHWTVVSGTARVTVGDDVRLLTENQSIYIPLGERHRLENPGRLPMVLIEVQTGAYLGEDDITRYDDVYARGQGAKG